MTSQNLRLLFNACPEPIEGVEKAKFDFTMIINEELLNQVSSRDEKFGIMPKDECEHPIGEYD